MDYSMPGCDGPCASKAFKEHLEQEAEKQVAEGESIAGNNRKPFICCLTAYTDEAHKNEALNAGVDLF